MNRAFYLFFLIAYCLFLPDAFAQNAKKITDGIVVNGYIKDAASLETLIGATVYIPEIENGAVTNLYGYYALKIPKSADSLTLQVSFIGYETQQLRVLANQDLNLTFDLSEASEVLDAIVVTENVQRQKIERNQMGVQKITAQKLKTIPVVFGEADIMKVLQLTAGVQGGAEGTSGLFVRGGGYDQNLFLLDEATVYNPEHFFGFFSTFNSDIIKNIEIYKSDFPAKYGGRLSSVVNVQMREGNMKKFEGQGGIGLIASRLTLEGPIKKNKSSFIISGRRTYLDLFTPAVNKKLSADQQIPNYFFYDFNAKLNFILGDKDRIYMSGYFGQDKLKIDFGSDDGGELANSSYDLKWGNITGTVRWNHIFNPRLFSNTSFIGTRYKYNDEFNFDDFFVFRSSSITNNYTLKQDFDYYLDTRHTVKFGGQYTHNLIQPTEYFAGTVTDDPDLQSDAISESQRFKGEEFALYVQDDWKVSPMLALKGGIRLSGFYTKGGDNGDKFYINPEPRFALNYQINKRASIKASYARMAQYLNQVKFTDISFLDPYFPANANIKPQLSDQVSAGWNLLLFNDKLSISNEYYYKWLHNQLDYANNADFLFIDENYHDRLAVGKGWSYGTELTVEITEGKTTGWMSYTLSWSRRQFDELNDGNFFPFSADRRHVFNLVFQQQLPRNWTISTNYTFRSGNTVDLPIGRFFSYGINGLDPFVVPVYGEKNSFRMNPYHRWDLSALKKFDQSKRIRSELAISIYNVYSRRNPFFIFYEDEIIPGENGAPNSVRFVAKQTSLFPIIPSITWNFKF